MKKYGIHNTKLIWVLKVIQIVALLGAAICLFTQWGTLPETVPVHFDFYGNVNRWGNKVELLMLPGLGIGIYALFTWMGHVPSIWNMPGKVKEEKKQESYQCMYQTLQLMNTFITLMFSYITITSVGNCKMSIWFVVIFMTGCSLPFIYSIFKIRNINRDNPDE